MKFLIASDIHGSAYYCKKLLDVFSEEKADRLILLGDLLYHGPRNDLPREYDPKQVIEMLNSISDKILCVRGNCDSEVDQMVLDFPIMADYAVISLNGRIIYATHGHILNPDNPPPLKDGDILLNGHTHVSKFTDNGKFSYMNPGSVSIPKDETPHSYMILENNEFLWKDLLTKEVYNKKII
ncbi:MAG: phosphodiesterase [Acutalibacteraceae bacterium]|jgi:putative phosphoesterase